MLESLSDLSLSYNAPLPGGHLDVVRLLVDQAADVDSQDNRKVSCLMAAFRKVRTHSPIAVEGVYHHVTIYLFFVIIKLFIVLFTYV